MTEPRAVATRPVPADAAGIQAEIERTRTEMASTVDALSAKLDVSARAKEKVAEVTDGTKSALARAVATVKANPVPTGAVVVLVVSAVALVVERSRR